MKCRSSPFLFYLAAALPSSALAEASPVRVRVEQVSKSDTIACKSVPSRSLNLTLSNSGGVPVELKVKYVIFGRDIESKEAVARGEMPAAVPACGTQKIQTPVAQAAAEEARTGSKGKSEAIGQRIIGQGVQVLQGETVVAESFEPASLKESFASAPLAAPLDPQKKQKK